MSFETMKLNITMLLAALLSFITGYAGVGIIPRPLTVAEGKGSFPITSRTVIAAPELLRTSAEIFAEDLARALGVKTAVVTDGNAGRAIRLAVDTSLEKEEYLLAVTRKGVTIRGGTPQGVFYGLQSLLQLVVANAGDIPAVVVQDKPCMAYRGAMLDACRHFFPVEAVKRYIDLLALHKLNRFHWHLTDDQGWRIEIKRYPRLTEIGSWRRETLVGLMPKKGEEMQFDGRPYGGYYTQDQIREVVAYAAARYIEVIPEIEMPGHGLGALTAYPWLGCTGGPYEVWTRWGISEDVYCAGKDTTYEFIEHVLEEVIGLFPSRLIHIGGDECPKHRWKECPACRGRIAEENLEDEKALQSYFVRRIEKWLQAHGREIIGWDEILEGGISPTATIMVWRDQQHGIEAVRKGNKVIMTPKWNCYLDYSQTSDPKRWEPLCNLRYLPLRQVYRLDPYDRRLPKERENVLGVQANVWTEYMPDMQCVERMVLPRLAALAETAWACDRKDYNDFVRRLRDFVRVYDLRSYRYSDFVFRGIE